MPGLAILAAVLVTVFAAYRLLVVKPSLPEPGAERPDEDQNYEFGEGPRLSGDRKEEFYTFLLVGRDTGGGGNTDTLMVMAYDIPNQTLNVMSIPRDTMVNVPWDIKRINSVYNYAPYYDKDGIQFLKEEVSYLIGFQPDYTIVVEWEAVGELVDAIGGVYFDVPRRMYYNDLSQHFKIDLQPGYQLLDGNGAMGVLRWRHNSDDSGHILNSGYAMGDLGRIKTQQAFLTAMVDQLLQIKNVTRSPVHPGVPEQCGDRPELPEYPMVCPAGDSGWAEHGERGVCHHAQPDRILLEPHLSQLSILRGAQRG